MKNGKRPTRKEKELLASLRLHVDNWLVVKHTGAEMEIVHRHTGQTRTIKLRW